MMDNNDVARREGHPALAARAANRTAFVFKSEPFFQISNLNTTGYLEILRQFVNRTISHASHPHTPHPVVLHGAKSSGAKSSPRAHQDESNSACHLLCTVLLCFSRVCHRWAARWPPHAGFCPPLPLSMNPHLLPPLHRNEMQHSFSCFGCSQPRSGLPSKACTEMPSAWRGRCSLFRCR